MAVTASETVLGVRHWTDALFSFTTTRAPTLCFANGQFVMVGLMVAGKPLMRAYSIASANSAGDLARNLAMPELDSQCDRAMVCGSANMLAEMREMLDARGFHYRRTAESRAITSSSVHSSNGRRQWNPR